MTAYRKFNPDAALQEIQKRGGGAAKVAKPPKVSDPEGATLATLATLAGGAAQNRNCRSAIASPQWDASAWQAALDERVETLQRGGAYSRPEAGRRVWGELQNQWHRLNGSRTPPSICAGCRQVLGGRGVMALLDGAMVHADPDFACLRVYGESWRQAATLGLIGLGLNPPTGSERPHKEN